MKILSLRKTKEWIDKIGVECYFVDVVVSTGFFKKKEKTISLFVEYRPKGKYDTIVCINTSTGRHFYNDSLYGERVVKGFIKGGYEYFVNPK